VREDNASCNATYGPIENSFIRIQAASLTVRTVEAHGESFRQSCGAEVPMMAMTDPDAVIQANLRRLWTTPNPSRRDPRSRLIHY
jgi:hypothetical protein